MDLLTSIEVAHHASLPDSCRHLRWSARGLLLACDDGTVATLDHPLADLRILHRLAAPPTALASTPDGFVIGALDGSVCTSDACGGEDHGLTRSRFDGPVMTIAHVGDCVVVGHGLTAEILGTQARLELPIGTITRIEPVVGRMCVVGGTAGMAWFDAGLVVADDWMELPEIVSVAADPRQRVVALGDLGGSIHLVRPGTAEANELTGYPDGVELLAWLGTGAGLLACASDELTMWPVEPDGQVLAEEPAQLVGHDAPITAMAVSPTDELVATGNADGLVRIWAPTRVSTAVAALTTDGIVLGLRWQPDGRALAVTTSAGVLVVAHVRPGELA